MSHQTDALQSQHILSVFGGAGPQHACAIARNLGIIVLPRYYCTECCLNLRYLGMSTVFVHKFCSILSAYGLGLADVVFELQVPSTRMYFSKLLLKLRYLGASWRCQVRRSSDGRGQQKTQRIGRARRRAPERERVLRKPRSYQGSRTN